MKKYVLLFILVTLPLTSAFARLGDGLDINGFEVHVMADAGLGYDDNVFLTSVSEQNDYFWNLKSYIDVEKEVGRDGKFFLSYETDFYRYDEFNSEDSDNHYLLGGLELVFNNFYVHLNDEYVDTENINGILFTNRITRTIHEPSALLGLNFNKIALELKKRCMYRRYKDDILDIYDHNEDAWLGSLVFHAFTKTDILVEYETTEIDYLDSDRDGEYEQLRVGVKGEITPKITGSAWFGYQDRDYDISGQKFDNEVAEVDLDWNFTEELKLNFNYLLTANESIIERNNYYQIDRIALDFSRDVEGGLIFNIGGFVEWDDFPFEQGITREDKVNNFFIRVGWEFKEWLAVDFKWDWQKRESNIPNEDYEQNNFLLYLAWVL